MSSPIDQEAQRLIELLNEMEEDLEKNVHRLSQSEIACRQEMINDLRRAWLDAFNGWKKHFCR